MTKESQKKSLECHMKTNELKEKIRKLLKKVAHSSNYNLYFRFDSFLYLFIRTENYTFAAEYLYQFYLKPITNEPRRVYVIILEFAIATTYRNFTAIIRE